MLLQVISILLAGVLSTIAGVGGGGILLPIYIYLLNFEINEAIPLTIITILGNCVVRFFYLYNKKILNMKKRFLVDILPCLIIVPFDGNVSFIGIYLSLYLPKIVNLFCVVLVMLVLFVKTVKKYIVRYKNEKKNEIIYCVDGISLPIREENYVETNIGENIVERNNLVMYLFFCIFLTSIFSYVINIFDRFSIEYNILLFLQLLTLGYISIKNVKKVVKIYDNRRKNNFSFIPNDIRWNKKTY